MAASTADPFTWDITRQSGQIAPIDGQNQHPAMSTAYTFVKIAPKQVCSE
ncbi:hypothetical protein [Micromonospora sp. NPDC047740]